MLLLVYQVQEAILEELLFANAPRETDRDDYIPANFLTKESPPIYIFHGEVDNHVGIEQSYSLVAAFKTTVYAMSRGDSVSGSTTPVRPTWTGDCRDGGHVWLYHETYLRFILFFRVQAEIFQCQKLSYCNCFGLGVL